jgi:uncharacterized protein YigA (DUF484 family)
MTKKVTHQDVEEFLLDHPEFFLSRDGLLAELELPHESGSAISLVERQVSVLRERSRDSRQRLNRLLETVRENDRLFQKTENLVLSLLEADSLDQLATTIQESLRDDFQVECNALILFADEGELAEVNARVVTLDEANDKVNTILASKKATCGVLRDVEMEFLFGDSAKTMGSAAVAPLHFGGQMLGLLAVGSADPEKYRSSMGTLFLSYIASVLERIIKRFL